MFRHQDFVSISVWVRTGNYFWLDVKVGLGPATTKRCTTISIENRVSLRHKTIYRQRNSWIVNKLARDTWSIASNYLEGSVGEAFRFPLFLRFIKYWNAFKFILDLNARINVTCSQAHQVKSVSQNCDRIPILIKYI